MTSKSKRASKAPAQKAGSDEVHYVYNSKLSMITSDQIRAARALLDWSLADLSAKSGIGQQAISKLENKETKPLAKTLENIQSVLEEAGVEFLPTGGIQPRQDIMKIYKGRTGFIEFIWDVHKVASTHGGDICVSNVKEEDFMYWLGEEDPVYGEAMKSARENYKFRILVEDGDKNLAADYYAEYRWMPKEHFASIPFYVYGDKLAIILFQQDVTVYVIEDRNIAEAQRKQFNLAWQIAKHAKK